jgi:hypothetical protein
VLGILAFLGGAALIAFAFQLGLQLFNQPPAVVLNVKPDASLNVNEVVQNLGQSVLKVLLLIVLALIGSFACNAGIRLYSHSAGRRGAAAQPARAADEDQKP